MQRAGGRTTLFRFARLEIVRAPENDRLLARSPAREIVSWPKYPASMLLYTALLGAEICFTRRKAFSALQLDIFAV